MNLKILGLIFTVSGALILLLNNIFTGRHQKDYGQPWYKRYWWQGWRPAYIDTKTLEWKIKWTRKTIAYGFIPPKYFWEMVGFLFILIGTILQIKEL